MSIHSQTHHQLTAVNKGHCYTKNLDTGSVDKSLQDRKREPGTCMEDSEYLLDDNKECECLLNDDDEAAKQKELR